MATATIFADTLSDCCSDHGDRVNEVTRADTDARFPEDVEAALLCRSCDRIIGWVA